MARNSKQSYGNDSIVSLKGPDRVRKRPAVIFGSDGLEGCEHSLFEIISNSIDEAREGYGNRITVTKYSDNSVEVRDLGRGIPVDFNTKENEYNWKLLFCELYAGSKYDNDKDGSYEYSLGLNGLGLCATQYASEYMEAEVKTGGYLYHLRFEKGFPVGEMSKEPYPKSDTGTTIRWKPDLDVFTDIAVPDDWFEQTLNRQSVVNAGVTFEFRRQLTNGRFETKQFFHPDGINDYGRELAGDSAMTSVMYCEGEDKGRDREDMPDYKVRMSCAFCFSKQFHTQEFYHNSSMLEHGGSPEQAVRSAFLSEIDAYLKQNGKYAKNDPKISFQDIEDCLIIVTSSFSTRTSYENQTKKAITNKFIREAMTKFLRRNIEVYFIENRIEADKIAEQVIVNMRSRVRSEATRLQLKNTLLKGNTMTDRIEKFVDCRSKDVSQREIFIVEGDSALGACKQARDSAFQAVIPVRGKILNCLKSDYDKIFKNEIITDLIKVLGCGVEVRTKQKDLYSFDIDKLRWSKVIICTDADVDGYQIRTLILTMFYRLMPKLITEGKVFIAQSPLYEINTANGTWFAYNESEKTAALEEIGSAKYTIQRSKGLGENDADMMWLTTMNPETRRLIKVEPGQDPENVSRKFDLLLGNDLEGRKEHIARYGSHFIDLADLS
ncbi:MAG: DNA topoisomerase [Clostridia bacterium]|nr:DNA topoisomerase [Clostridia bacterium]